ncbi:helix-turn-helix transcriptional regulator [Steroidobacter sp. S1-65]|uniref:Helix-turn-helix transcriptional regulator n=1 Tax=Steroidobacter gossypii TaxID=2805490 RepID=A0ABS1X3P0_9GAMM|nr:AraC family transcriptional regulator [Steroidobacter gossypii]MBM0107841.1 helix-turn-helix transcriptional regulator [Steroidobacter gossypii]
MTLESFNTLLLALTGPAAALLLAAVLLTLRPMRGPQELWLSVWLVGLAIRFGKSTLNALVGLESWALNIGLAGMALAPPALLLAIKASAGMPFNTRQLIHFAPAAVLAVGAGWIPNVSGEPISALIYIGILLLWAGYTLMAWRLLLTAGPQSPSDRHLMKVIASVTTVAGCLFVAIFVGLPQFYLLNCAVFSFAVLGLAALLAIEISNRPRPRIPATRIATPDQIALTDRARAVLADRRVLANHGMSLASMARKLGVAQKTLSTAINAVTGESFTTLMNTGRIAVAQRELLTTTNSIEVIAERCGFSSASAFHRTFRRHVQLTPAEWRRNNGTRPAVGRAAAGVETSDAEAR